MTPEQRVEDNAYESFSDQWGGNDDMMADLVAGFVPRSALAASEAEITRIKEANENLGAWMSAALDDPKVCEAMKTDINEWFLASR